MKRNDRMDYINNNIIPNIKRKFSKDNFKRFWNMSYAMGLILIVIGLLFVFLPMYVSGSLGIIAGVLMFIYGLSTLIAFFVDRNRTWGKELLIVKAILFMGFGLIFIIYPLTLMSIITFFIGAFFIIDGFIKVKAMVSIPMRRTISWWITFLLAAVVGGMGLFVVLFPFKGIEAIMTISGVAIIISGLQKIMDTWRKLHP